MVLDKIKYIKSYSATSISELTNEQIQEVIDYEISSEKLPLVTDHVTEISETAVPKKSWRKFIIHISAKAGIHIDYDDVYFDYEFDYDSTPQSVKETNEVVA